MVVVSLGSRERDKKLEVSGVKFSPKETIITVKQKPAPKANEKNPYILVGLDLKKKMTSNKAGVPRTSGFFFTSAFHAGR